MNKGAQIPCESSIPNRMMSPWHQSVFHRKTKKKLEKNALLDLAAQQRIAQTGADEHMPRCIVAEDVMFDPAAQDSL